MTLEDEIFAKTKPDFRKFINFGFTKKENQYIFQKRFMDGHFQAQLVVTKQGDITGKVIDLDTEDEYLPLHTAQTGEFVNQVRAEYSKILNRIANNCFIKLPFHTPQANRLAELIKTRLHTNPEFIFKRAPDYAVFRNASSNKWYGLLMYIQESRLLSKNGLSRSSQYHSKNIDILDLKIKPEQHQALLHQPGIYPGYHLSNTHWITVVLDDTISDQEIFKLVQASYQLTLNNKNWLIPANPKYFDIMHAFDNKEQIIWKQSTNVHTGDTVFLYVAAPISAIAFKCQVIETNIPYQFHSKQVKMSQVMKIKLIKRYPTNKFNFSYLKAHGIKAIRGPRHLPDSLLSKL